MPAKIDYDLNKINAILVNRVSLKAACEKLNLPYNAVRIWIGKHAAVQYVPKKNNYKKINNRN